MGFIAVPAIAMENTGYFNLWVCFLEWDGGDGATTTFERRNWAGLVDQDPIRSASKMLEWVQKVKTSAENRLLEYGKETTQLIVEKAFKCGYGMEVVTGEEGEWKESLDCVWRAIAYFMRIPKSIPPTSTRVRPLH